MPSGLKPFLFATWKHTCARVCFSVIILLQLWWPTESKDFVILRNTMWQYCSLTITKGVQWPQKGMSNWYILYWWELFFQFLIRNLIFKKNAKKTWIFVYRHQLNLLTTIFAHVPCDYSLIHYIFNMLWGKKPKSKRNCLLKWRDVLFLWFFDKNTVFWEAECMTMTTSMLTNKNDLMQFNFHMDEVWV